MPSLIDIPELVVFFSYSRDDDQGSGGALSALRDAIQTELSATRPHPHRLQLVAGQVCDFVRDTLGKTNLARHQSIGIFYSDYYAAGASIARTNSRHFWRANQSSAATMTSQSFESWPPASISDWRKLRHHNPRSIEVQQKLEWYCRGITNALHETWIPPISPNALKRDELEAAGTKPHLNADALRRAEQDELAGKGETQQPVPRGTKPRASRRATRSAREAEGITR
jgi:hypothetical protein